jgi:hypothetical protein
MASYFVGFVRVMNAVLFPLSQLATYVHLQDWQSLNPYIKYIQICKEKFIVKESDTPQNTHPGLLSYLIVYIGYFKL